MSILPGSNGPLLPSIETSCVSTGVTRPPVLIPSRRPEVDDALGKLTRIEKPLVSFLRITMFTDVHSYPCLTLGFLLVMPPVMGTA